MPRPSKGFRKNVPESPLPWLRSRYVALMPNANFLVLALSPLIPPSSDRSPVFHSTDDVAATSPGIVPLSSSPQHHPATTRSLDIAGSRQCQSPYNPPQECDHCRCQCRGRGRRVDERRRRGRLAPHGCRASSEPGGPQGTGIHFGRRCLWV